MSVWCVEYNTDDLFKSVVIFIVRLITYEILLTLKKKRKFFLNAHDDRSFLLFNVLTRPISLCWCPYIRLTFFVIASSKCKVRKSSVEVEI